MLFAWKKKRSPLGEWMDENDVSQEWLSDETGLSRNAVSDLCSGKVSNPRTTTRQKVIKALRKKDPCVSAADFW